MNPTRRKQDKNLITPCKTNLSPRYIRSNPRIPKKIPRRMKELKSFFETNLGFPSRIVPRAIPRFKSNT